MSLNRKRVPATGKVAIVGCKAKRGLKFGNRADGHLPVLSKAFRSGNARRPDWQRPAARLHDTRQLPHPSAFTSPSQCQAKMRPQGGAAILLSFLPLTAHLPGLWLVRTVHRNWL